MNRQELKAEVKKYSDDGQYVKAMPLMEQYCELIAQEFGYDSDRYVTVINDLGGMYRNVGDWEKAEATFNKALELVEKRLGDRSTQYATVTVNLACMYRFLGQFERAESLFLNAISIYDEDAEMQITEMPDVCVNTPENNKTKREFENKLLEKSTLYANACNNIGVLYQDMGLYDKALFYHEKSLNFLKYTNNYEYLAISLNNLVNPLMKQGEFDKALEAVLESIGILKEHVSINHPFYSTSINSLGTIYFYQKKYKEALDCFLEAKTFLVDSFGEKSPQYISCLKNIEVVENMIKNGE